MLQERNKNFNMILSEGRKSIHFISHCKNFWKYKVSLKQKIYMRHDCVEKNTIKPHLKFEWKFHKYLDFFFFFNDIYPRWYSVKESVCHCRNIRRHGFSPQVRKIPWSRKWQSTTVFLPGKFHGQRSLAGCSSWGHKDSDATE